MMGALSYAKELIPKIVGFKLARLGLIRPPLPTNFTISITNMCNSRCKTCNLWKHYIEHPEMKEKELSVEEMGKIFKSVGHTYFLNISGGEPFLRKDFPKIIEYAMKYMTPSVIHTPTNALLPERIEKTTEEIMKVINKYNPNVEFTIKPSYDGVGKKHDEIRGVKGNYEKLLDTLKRLNKLQEKYPNLHVGVGTVISVFSIKSLKETIENTKNFKIDSYISEVAEQRSELFNETDNITPHWREYKKAISLFADKTKKLLKKSKGINRLVLSMRLAYYDLAVKILKEKRQVIPCYSGLASVHVSPFGDVWPCCILGYSKSMGNLRDTGYDFKKVWYSKEAKKVRRFIRKKNCACPLANNSLTNMLSNPWYMTKILFHAIFG